MKKLLLVSALMLAVAFGAFAEFVNNPSTAAIETNPGPIGQGGGAGSCTLVYYNFCSGWIWIYSGFNAGDQMSVQYDLPTDCGKLPGEACCHTGHFWYWRYTQPGYGFSVTYDLYNTDASGCLVGGSLGSATIDPTERWNYTGGLGCATSDVVALAATMDVGTLPYAVTDHNVAQMNAMGPLGCLFDTGTPGNGTSLFHYDGLGGTTYCPPQAFGDAIGYVDFTAIAYFTCDTATEDASWGEIKSLFQ